MSAFELPLPSSLPFVLAPSSRPSSPTATSSVLALTAQIDAADSLRRKTGSLAGGRKGIIPPLHSVRFIGAWESSPWTATASHLEKPAATADLTQEHNEGAWERGLPRDMEEWQQWQQEDQQRAAKKARRRSPSKSLASTGSSGTLITKTSLATSISQEPVAGAGVKKQQSLVGSFGTSSTKALLPAGINKKPLPESKGTESSFPTVTASHAAPRQPQPIPLAARPSSSKSAETPAAVDRPTRQSNDDGKKTGAKGLDLRREEEEDEGMSFHRAEAGKSLGEDEEVLFEGGCTQMVLPPPTHPSVPSPLTSPAKDLPPSFPNGLPTSTPHQLRRGGAPPAPLSSPAFNLLPGSATKDDSLLLPAATLPSPDSSPMKPSIDAPPPLSLPHQSQRLLDGLLHSPFSRANGVVGKVDPPGDTSFLPHSQALSSISKGGGESQSPVRGKLMELSGEGGSSSTQGSLEERVGEVSAFLEGEMSL